MLRVTLRGCSRTAQWGALRLVACELVEGMGLSTIGADKDPAAVRSSGSGDEGVMGGALADNGPSRPSGAPADGDDGDRST